jgi:hypothetical protein
VAGVVSERERVLLGLWRTEREIREAWPSLPAPEAACRILDAVDERARLLEGSPAGRPL